MTHSPPPLAALLAEWIATRERQRGVEAQINGLQSAWDAAFSRFANDVQSAVRLVRDDVSGGNHTSAALLRDLAEQAADWHRLAQSLPAGAPPEWQGIAEAIAVAGRKADAALFRYGVEPVEPRPGDPYDPVRQERIGGRTDAGLAGTVAETRERGYASAGPPGVVRRARVIVCE